MKVCCPHCQEEINLSIFLNREIKKKESEPDTKILKTIAQIVCENAGITIEDLRKKERTRIFVKSRQQFMYLSNTYTNFSLGEIGKFIWPELNHATVIHGIRAIKDLIESSSQEALEMQFLTDQLEKELINIQYQQC